MIHWLKKKLGYHVCEHFTQWERKVTERNLVYFTSFGFPIPNSDHVERIIWQERTCTECGRIFQKLLNYIET